MNRKIKRSRNDANRKSLSQNTAKLDQVEVMGPPQNQHHNHIKVDTFVMSNSNDRDKPLIPNYSQGEVTSESNSHLHLN